MSGFSARPTGGCRPDLAWPLTEGEEEFEIDSGEITSAGRYGINGLLDEADRLTLTIRPLHSSRCTVTVTWGITSW